jgi:hypothetical protein
MGVSSRNDLKRQVVIVAADFTSSHMTSCPGAAPRDPPIQQWRGRTGIASLSRRTRAYSTSRGRNRSARLAGLVPSRRPVGLT